MLSLWVLLGAEAAPETASVMFSMSTIIGGRVRVRVRRRCLPPFIGVHRRSLCSVRTGKKRLSAASMRGSYRPGNAPNRAGETLDRPFVSLPGVLSPVLVGKHCRSAAALAGERSKQAPRHVGMLGSDRFSFPRQEEGHGGANRGTIPRVDAGLNLICGVL